MLAVAEQVFAEHGYLAASMDEIAERVGVSKPMLYEYFGSKEGLFVGCIERARAQLLAATERAVAGAATPADALRRGLVAFFRFVAEHRRYWRLIRQEAALTPPAAAAAVEQIRQQQSAFTAAMLTALADVDLTEASAEILVGACERLALWVEHRPEITPEQAAELVMAVVWTGLGGRVNAAQS
ncbi:transcriptional regulator, TetR family [Goodfellowiella coeruleoviolacea]|uniref:Transcriptional regulator, TetR family n=2 Tax=Goodfellowiella coeruleoviolacea TaxID=334858 RepID=A0AAE3GD05_9PSEU|nr:transcriptional regulator, TetR family [Goodfellowiella coeruleoviolacea]